MLREPLRCLISSLCHPGVFTDFVPFSPLDSKLGAIFMTSFYPLSSLPFPKCVVWLSLTHLMTCYIIILPIYGPDVCYRCKTERGGVICLESTSLCLSLPCLPLSPIPSVSDLSFESWQSKNQDCLSDTGIPPSLGYERSLFQAMIATMLYSKPKPSKDICSFKRNWLESFPWEEYYRSGVSSRHFGIRWGKDVNDLASMPVLPIFHAEMLKKKLADIWYIILPFYRLFSQQPCEVCVCEREPPKATQWDSLQRTDLKSRCYLDTLTIAACWLEGGKSYQKNKTQDHQFSSLPSSQQPKHRATKVLLLCIVSCSWSTVVNRLSSSF